ncbi:hypothetical protein IF1G_05868 [Cordyceps javanica]|uniref:Uncharacterized protein n=1 Tax=Cordyceps javanica TaxID=43265 RepID=A0A545V2T6_9HYPO|nr:hypothetical protein IF1G_05868 [Cordyceps javanica]
MRHSVARQLGSIRIFINEEYFDPGKSTHQNRQACDHQVQEVVPSAVLERLLQRLLTASSLIEDHLSSKFIKTGREYLMVPNMAIVRIALRTWLRGGMTNPGAPSARPVVQQGRSAGDYSSQEDQLSW